MTRLLLVRHGETTWNFDQRMQGQTDTDLSDFGRQRMQFDSTVRREIWKDVILAVNVFDTFDSQPPAVDADRNDVGVVLSFGWSY